MKLSFVLLNCHTSLLVGDHPTPAKALSTSQCYVVLAKNTILGGRSALAHKREDMQVAASRGTCEKPDRVARR
jgi:hypothetical protein